PHTRTGTRPTPGAPFPWARVGTPALLRHAATAGWTPVEQWTVTDQTDQIPGAQRCFVSLRRRPVPHNRG
ncbi:SAM-dependent methyltransferase, partial [Streptomyces decoyicus]